MTKLITVERAKKEIERLKSFVELVETYETNTVEKFVIKQYAYTNSIGKVVEYLSQEGITSNGEPINKEFVLNVIKSKPTDELHKLLRTGYMLKTRSNRRSTKSLI